MYFYLKSNKGIVLITTLWVLSILAVFAIALSYRAAMMINVTRKLNSRLSAYYAAKAGIYYAIDVLLKDEHLEVDYLGEDWAKQISKELEGGRLIVNIVDENRKINFNALINMPTLIGRLPDPYAVTVLLNILGIPSDLAGSIIDYADTSPTKIIDPETSETTEMIENLYFTDTGLTAGATLKLLDELFMVKAMTNEMMNNLKNNFCADSPHGRLININTVNFSEDYRDSTLLYNLGLTSGLISAIGQIRGTGDFISNLDIFRDYLDPLKQYLGITSNLFSITSRGYSLRDSSYYEINVLFNRDEKKIVTWQQKFIAG